MTEFTLHVSGLLFPCDNVNKSNCGVTAIAILAELPFTLCKKIISFSHHKNWKGGLSIFDIKNHLRHFAIPFTQHQSVEPIPLNKWCKKYAQPNVSYLVATTGHAQVVRNGYVADQGGIDGIDFYWGKRKIVKHVLEIEK